MTASRAASTRSRFVPPLSGGRLISVRFFQKSRNAAESSVPTVSPEIPQAAEMAGDAPFFTAIYAARMPISILKNASMNWLIAVGSMFRSP
ncbi:unknown [Ruminococcus sp. CAG:382]|nr:unknown [Ruminococcus sp. CAG:382]